MLSGIRQLFTKYVSQFSMQNNYSTSGFLRKVPWTRQTHFLKHKSTSRRENTSVLTETYVKAKVCPCYLCRGKRTNECGHETILSYRKAWMNTLMLVTSLKNKQTKPAVILKCQFRKTPFLPTPPHPPFPFLWALVNTAWLYREWKKQVFEAFQNKALHSTSTVIRLQYFTWR